MSNAFPHRLGRTLSLFAGLVHIVWALLIWLGWATPLLGFVYDMHSLKIAFTVGAMSASKGLGLVILTMLVGYAAGFIIGTIWEKVK